MIHTATKILAAIAFVLAVISSTVHAAEEAVSMPGGISISSASSPQQQQVTSTSGTGISISSASEPRPAAIDVRFGTSDVLNRGAAITNKNTLATDNNVFVSNSNLLFRSNDRISLARKIESLVLSEAAAGMDMATLSNNIMRVVQTTGGNDVTMSKTSGVLASKASGVATAAQSGSLGDLRQRIMDLVSSAMSS